MFNFYFAFIVISINCQRGRDGQTGATGATGWGRTGATGYRGPPGVPGPPGPPSLGSDRSSQIGCRGDPAKLTCTLNCLMQKCRIL